ncbi:MAG: ferrous iron transporter B [Anaerolineae bacterium]|nr:ferrous iron transporter B [Anaerolineae bacterium]
MSEQATTPEELLSRADALRGELGDSHSRFIEDIYQQAAEVADKVVSQTGQAGRFNLDRALDRVLTSPVWGLPIMVLMLGVVLWLTISGANIPSGWLATLLLDWVYNWLHTAFQAIAAPWWIEGFLVDGVYLAVAWVTSVMLPPMAIFFPLFTLLEDFGYLPRVAFNLDRAFAKAGAHGKQALTMTMGFGCNAAGVIATRIIDSPRERLLAIITNNFSLCNGRWPTQILIATIFIGALVPPVWSATASMLAVLGVAVLGVGLTFGVSWGLTKTVLKGEASTFSLELPPYRPPQILRTLYTSVIDRTLIVLWRAVTMAAPAGAVIWLLGNIDISGVSIAEHLVTFLDPIGWFVGLNGVILLAYVVAIPANEIVIPTILMLTLMVGRAAGADAGVMIEFDTARETASVLVGLGGWTLLTGINLMLFSLMHNPCSTTIMTIYQETKSLKWTTVATLLPVVMGLITTGAITWIARALHLV